MRSRYNNEVENITMFFFPIGILIVNLVYFIPKTIKWLAWESGVTMGYVALELSLNYVIHCFLFYSVLSLLYNVDKKYKMLLFSCLVLLFFISFVFAFKIIENIVFAFVLIYSCMTYKIIFSYPKIDISKYKRINQLGFFLSIIWLVLDIVYFT